MKMTIMMVFMTILLMGCSTGQRAQDFYTGYEMRKPDGTIYAATPGTKDRNGCLREAKALTGSSWWSLSSSSLCSENDECRKAYDRCMHSRGYVIRGRD